MTARVPVETTSAKPPIAADSAPARPPSPPPRTRPAPDPAREIRALVAAYATALEARSLDAIRRVYPTLQPAQAREWEEFFNAVSDIDVELRVTGLEISGASANAQLAGVYSFTDPSSRRLKHENVGFTARLRRDGGTWLIESLR